MSRDYERYIRDVPDFPRPGIVFKDLTTLFIEAAPFRAAMRDLESRIDWDGVTHIAGIEARGFILAGYLAARRDLGLIPIRKPGKLPAETLREEYALEYGSDCVEMHRDAGAGNPGVLIVDDLLATGGTARAAARLVERAGGRVTGIAFLVELAFLDGRARLGDRNIISLIRIAD